MGNKPVVLSKDDILEKCGKNNINDPVCKAYRVNIIYTFILTGVIGLGIILYCIYLLQKYGFFGLYNMFANPTSTSISPSP